MQKFHIRDNGELGVCLAVDACPLGTDTPHAEFKSKKEAQAWVEKINETKAGGIFTKSDRLAKEWAFNSVLASSVAKGDAEAREILEAKILTAESKRELDSVSWEFRELVKPYGNYELAAELIEKVDRPEVMDAIAKGLNEQINDDGAGVFLKKLYAHPYANPKLRGIAVSSRALTYSEKVAMLDEKSSFTDRIALIASTNWQDEGNRNLADQYDAAVDDLRSGDVRSITLTEAATLIRAARRTGSELDPNLVFGKLNRKKGYLEDPETVIAYGQTNVHKMNSHSLIVLTDTINASGSYQQLSQLKNVAEKEFGPIKPRRNFPETEVDSLKRRYEAALQAAGGSIRRNFISDENDRARKARDDYNMTRLPQLTAEYEEASKAAVRLLSSGKARAIAQRRMRELSEEISGARTSLMTDALIRKFESLK